MEESKLTILGYLRGLGKDTVNQRSARELMEQAPDGLPKKINSWIAAVSAVRAEFRGRPHRRGTTPMPKLVPMGINSGYVNQRIQAAVDREMQEIQRELQEVGEKWRKFQG